MIFVNIAGLLLIAGIVWWFWLYKPPEFTVGNGVIEVLVENGTYEPAHIRVPAQQPVILKFKRLDASPCAETVVFPELEISEDLPLNELKEVVLPAMNSGTYAFTCQMQMYRGELIVG